MEWFLFIALLFASALYSGSEIAFIASNQLKFMLKAQEEAENGKKYFIYNPSKFLTTTLVGNNIVMVTTSTFAAVLLAPYMVESVQIIVTTVALLIFGEIIPKSVGQQMPNRLAGLVRIFITISYYIFYLLIQIAESLSKVLIKLFGGETQDVELFFKKDDLPVLIREYASGDKFSSRDQALTQRAIHISEKKVYDVMIHRTNIIAAEKNTSITDILSLFQKTGVSRIPIYEENMDQIIGIVYLFDLFRPNIKSFARLIRPAIFIPETTRAIKALQKLRNDNKSIALAIDEHGGIAGMLTLEDLVEELFGNISDEYDNDRHMSRKSNKSTIIAAGASEINQLNELYKLNIPVGDYVTIGGFLAKELQRIPVKGDKVLLPNAEIWVTKADSVKVIELQIILKPIITSTAQ